MELIEYGVYKDLIASRADREKDLSMADKMLNEVSLDLDSLTSFLDKYEATQVELNESIAELEKSITSGQEKLEAKEKEADATKRDLDEAQSAVKQETSRLAAMKDKYNSQEEKDPELAAQIKEVEAEIIRLQDLVTAKQKSFDDLQASIEALKDTIKSDKVAESTAEEALETNKVRKEAADEEGELERLTNEKTRLTAEKNEEEAKLNDFNTKNQAIITSYETQENARSRNIIRKPAERLYNRPPANAEVLAKSMKVTRDVVKGEIEEGVTETEKDLREDALSAGSEKSFNPDFMDVSEAREYTLKNIWSTKQVAEQIKEACENGKYEVRFPSLSDNIIYTLQHFGYSVVLENIEANFEKDQDILVSWKQMGEEEKS